MSTYFKQVIIHPIVLLSVSDHHRRASKNGERVAGVLLGFCRNGRVDIMNSLAVPFSEDEADGVWFFDHQYMETIYKMTQRVTSKEVLVGWYSTAPQIRSNDNAIHKIISNHCTNPLYVTFDLSETTTDLPVHAYISSEEVGENGKTIETRFVHVPTDVGSDENEVGVERLLKDMQKPTATVLKHEINVKSSGVHTLTQKIMLMKEYLQLIEEGKLPMNNDIIQNIQNIFNLSPNIDAFVQQFAVSTNDVVVTMYLGQLVKSILAVHELIRNKNDVEFAAREKKKKEEEEALKKKENEQKEEKGEKVEEKK